MDKKSDFFISGVLISFLIIIVLVALNFLFEVPIGLLTFKIVVAIAIFFVIAGVISILFFD
jgi:hypothetical protein